MSTPGLQIDGKPLRVVQTTPVTLIEQTPIVKVNIFEAPCELNDSYIINHFSQYGDLQSNTVYHQTFKNGVRSINYLNLKKPIPTVVWVQGNRVKTSHPDQDRTAFCSVCRTKVIIEVNAQSRMHQSMQEQNQKNKQMKTQLLLRT